VVWGSNSGRGRGLFSSPQGAERPWGPPSFLFGGYRASFLGIKQSGREVDHPPPCSADVKNEWSHTFAPPYAFWAFRGKNLLLPLF